MSELQDKVNTLVNKMVQSEDGKWSLPKEELEGLDEALIFAVTAERRYRDTQSSYTKAQQKLKQQESVAEALQERILNSDLVLSDEQQKELNTLRKENPEAWRAKLDEYEAKAKSSLKEELAEIAREAGTKTELEIRKEQMEAWSASTGITLNDDIVQNDVPPRIVKKLEKGEITFEEFLEEVGEFLGKPKVIAGTEDSDEEDKSLTKVAGGATPSASAEEKDLVLTYEKTLF